jgi:non-ribosomal peptide synthase protein (TIGR01720 family)
LRVERVGLEDDFFELGGDSILSIQVVARAAEAGFQITPRQVFEHPTVAALAGVAVALGREAGSVAVEGPAPLTPIQHAFFKRSPADPHRFNMSVLLAPRAPLEPAALEGALAALLDRHDALRLRFEDRDGEWGQRVEAPGGPVPLVRLDLSALPAAARDAAFAAAADALQGSLDLERGVLRAGLIGLGDAERLLLIIHHLAVDAVSWRVLVEDFERAFADQRLPPVTTPFTRWAEALEAFAGSSEAARELPFWRAQAAAAALRLPLPLDREDGPDVEAASRAVTVSLDGAATRSFLKDAHRAYQTRPEELLLAALVQAVGGWTGERALWADVEGHGREPVFAGAEGIDLSRTVGWFTTVHPVWLDLRSAQGPAATVKAAKEVLRRVPHRGLGHGVLRHLRREALAEPAPEIAFNYLGQMDLLLGGSALFEIDPEPPGLPRSPRAARPYRLEVNAWIRDGRLAVSWGYGEGRHRRATIESLAESFLAALRELIEHCLAPDAGGFTPSDFPAAVLDQKSLDRLLGSLQGRGGRRR